MQNRIAQTSKTKRIILSFICISELQAFRFMHFTWSSSTTQESREDTLAVREKSLREMMLEHRKYGEKRANKVVLGDEENASVVQSCVS